MFLESLRDAAVFIAILCLMPLAGAAVIGAIKEVWKVVRSCIRQIG